MDCGIGMFLAALVSGAGIGWFVGVLKIHMAYGNRLPLKRRKTFVGDFFLRPTRLKPRRREMLKRKPKVAPPGDFNPCPAR